MYFPLLNFNFCMKNYPIQSEKCEHNEWILFLAQRQAQVLLLLSLELKYCGGTKVFLILLTPHYFLIPVEDHVIKDSKMKPLTFFKEAQKEYFILRSLATLWSSSIKITYFFPRLHFWYRCLCIRWKLGHDFSWFFILIKMYWYLEMNAAISESHDLYILKTL